MPDATVTPFTAQELATTRRALHEAGRRVHVHPDSEVTAATLAGRGALRVRPASGGDAWTVLLAHGGGFRAGTPATDRGVASHLAALLDGTVWLPDYRLAPEHPAPAARDDVLAAYRVLLDAGADPGRVALGGLSAGGGLALAAALAAPGAGLAAPGALLLFSPWADLTVTTASFTANAATDPILDAADARRGALAYAGALDPGDPVVSPLRADAAALAALPPTLVQASEDEVLLDDARRITDRVPAAVLQTWPGVIHCWQVQAPELPAAREAIAAAAQFLLSLPEKRVCSDAS